MADEGTASTLVLVGAILQLLFTIGLLIVGILGIIAVVMLIIAQTVIIIPFGPPAPPELDPLTMLLLGYTVLIMAMAIVGLVFTILWFRWRNTPSAKKTGLIISGILGLIFAGFLPGLLVLIAGAIVPSEAGEA